jgi:hypothetical protein
MCRGSTSCEATRRRGDTPDTDFDGKGLRPPAADGGRNRINRDALRATGRQPRIALRARTHPLRPTRRALRPPRRSTSWAYDRLRPAPDFYDLFKQVLGRLGYIEQEPGLPCNAKAVGKTYPRPSICFPEIIDFLKAATGPITRNDVIERLGVTPSSAFRTLSVLAKDGLLRVTHHREGAHPWDTYAWVVSSAPIPLRHPRSRGSGTFHHS